MATINNNTQGTSKKVYATDEEGMMRDAKEYASRDFKQTVEVFRKAGISADKTPDEFIAKALTLVKLDQIKKARLERVTYFD